MDPAGLITTVSLGLSLVELFNELFAQDVALAPDETARLNVRMRRVEAELCEDFREIVAMYERVLGTSHPDHYQLYEVCGT